MNKSPIGQTKSLPINGETKVFQIYEIDLNDLKYNVLNDRIYTSMYGLNLDSNNQNEINELIEEKIWSQDVESNINTMENINIFGQLEPGIVTSNGIVVDGNRRYTPIRKLQKKYPDKDFKYKAIIIDQERSFTDKEIKSFELMIQHGTDEKVKY